jgi:hypothetical protein
MSASTSAAGVNDVGGTVTFDKWHFGVFRFIAATNRKGDILLADGSVGQISGSTSRTPTATPNVMALGAAVGASVGLNFDGQIAEFWITNTDIQPDAAALKFDTLHKLALCGPFSIPHIAKDIIEYRSFRKAPASDADEANEVFHGALGRQTWSNVGGVTVTAHPPLPYYYAEPGQTIRNLTI